MATEAQIRANRLNAQLSTGPQSPEGKARVSGNRRTHGLAVSRHVILPGESQEDYDALLADLTSDLAPATALEEIFVNQAAEAHWKLRRFGRYEAEFLARYPNPFLIEDEKIARKYAQLVRYQAAAQRAFHKALDELRRLRAARAKELHQTLDAAATESERSHSKPIPHLGLLLQRLTGMVPPVAPLSSAHPTQAPAQSE